MKIVVDKCNLMCYYFNNLILIKFFLILFQNKKIKNELINWIKKGDFNLLSIVKSMSLQGLDGVLMNVEVDISAGMPSWEIVRLARCLDSRIQRKSENSNKKLWL